MHLYYTNVNDAFSCLVSDIHRGNIQTHSTPSRAGEVLTITEPVTVTYANPLERVLFNANRDCNPFFHLYESLWMLAGRNDIAPLCYYNSRMIDFSDDGKTQHAAYGYRWRNYFGYDQLDWIVEELTANPDSRRVVLSMWDAGQTSTEYAKGDIPFDPPEAREGSGDFYMAIHGGKDVPCNTQAYFRIVQRLGADPNVPTHYIRKPVLEMTVCNRSNDLVWGMLGANVVHFSFLQEYLAAKIGVGVGLYHQFTNNLHVYTERWQPEFWMSDTESDLYMPHTLDGENLSQGFDPYPLAETDNEAAILDREVNDFVSRYSYKESCQFNECTTWETPFLEHVAKPMMVAFSYHKEKRYASALEHIAKMQVGQDWQYVANQWLKRRQAKGLG